MHTSQSVLGSALKAAFTRVHEEVQTFRAGRVYLLQVGIAALKSIPEVTEAHAHFKKFLSPTYETPYVYFSAQAFVALIASFEVFLQDVLVAVIAQYPKKIGAQEFRLSEILDATGTEELIRKATDQHLNKLLYKKPADLLANIADLLSIDAGVIQPYWTTYVEAKARRDLAVHNGWICNDVYLRKVSEVGFQTNLTQGQSVLPLTDEYLDSVASNINQLAQSLTEQVMNVHLIPKP